MHFSPHLIHDLSHLMPRSSYLMNDASCLINDSSNKKSLARDVGPMFGPGAALRSKCSTRIPPRVRVGPARDVAGGKNPGTLVSSNSLTKTPLSVVIAALSASTVHDADPDHDHDHDRDRDQTAVAPLLEPGRWK